MERSRYKHTARYGTIWRNDRNVYPRVAHFQRRCFNPLPDFMRRRVHGWWHGREKERKRERSGESGREIRDAKHEIYRKLERRATPVRVSTWLFCIQFRLKRRRGFVSLDKFKLEWLCAKVNLWDRLLEEEIFSGCDLKRRKEILYSFL